MAHTTGTRGQQPLPLGLRKPPPPPTEPDRTEEDVKHDREPLQQPTPGEADVLVIGLLPTPEPSDFMEPFADHEQAAQMLRDLAGGDQTWFPASSPHGFLVALDKNTGRLYFSVPSRRPAADLIGCAKAGDFTPGEGFVPLQSQADLLHPELIPHADRCQRLLMGLFPMLEHGSPLRDMLIEASRLLRQAPPVH